ncbi:MAG: preprotein translocase subunit SecG [Candidatus Omnitrophica bacterium]|nr:preprotein translocase subunit SecG [Candidatus Omnitrophota bacterium]
MIILIIAVHVIVCILLIVLVLVQRGRGGGLVESFAGVESMFGTKTNEFLTRSTSVLSVIFFITCLSLAIMSVRQSKSLMRGVKPAAVTQAAQPAATAATTTQQVTPQKEEPKTPATQETPKKTP